LTNAVRHAGAGVVRVRLAGAAGALRAEVEDDGAGIAATATPGVGLASMRERVEELGGTLTVAERPGGGTRITALLPLPDAKIA
jgi:signal transduction histidine kinase